MTTDRWGKEKASGSTLGDIRFGRVNVRIAGSRRKFLPTAHVRGAEGGWPRPCTGIRLGTWLLWPRAGSRVQEASESSRACFTAIASSTPRPEAPVLRSGPGNVHFARSSHVTVGLVVGCPPRPQRSAEPTGRTYAELLSWGSRLQHQGTCRIRIWGGV